MSTTTGNDREMLHRIRWACRRGKLELDLWLLPIEDAWLGLSESMKIKTMSFLDKSDEALWSIFLEHPQVMDYLKRIDL